MPKTLNAKETAAPKTPARPKPSAIWSAKTGNVVRQQPLGGWLFTKDNGGDASPKGSGGVWLLLPPEGAEEGVYHLSVAGTQDYVAAGEEDPNLKASRLLEPTPFRLEPAHDGAYVLKSPTEDKVWTVAGPFDEDSKLLHIALQPRDGSDAQLFRVKEVPRTAN